MGKIIALLVPALLVVIGVALERCNGGDPTAFCPTCAYEAECEANPTCETQGFGAYPEY